MTQSRVDTFTPTELVTSYVDELDRELAAIDEEIEQHRLAWSVLEDRRQTVTRLRTRHAEALQTLSPPATLTDLVRDLEGVSTA